MQRTIVKSQPEIWSEVSDDASLTRHLGAFGEITITRVTPETAVAWEGDRVRGTVTLERSGWGTKVTATAEAVEGAATPDAESFAAPEAPADVAEPEPEPEPELVVEPKPEPEASTRDMVPPVGTNPRVDGEAPKLRWWQRLWRRPVEAPVATPVVPELETEPEPVAIVETEPEPEPVATVETEPEPVATVENEPEPEPEPELTAELESVLSAMLDHLSAAHHRPFSRG